MSESEEDLTPIQTEAGLGESKAASESHIPGIDGFEFKNKAGAGSFGDVWRAVQLTTGQEVAVKLFKVDSLGAREQFQRELERLKKVSAHPFVVGLIDADLMHDPPYLVMPWLPNNLSALGEQTVVEVLSVIKQIAEALKFTHDKGLLHCDLKPGNILLDEGGQVRLADFGQSLALGQDRGTWGTLGWMPPEQALLGPETIPAISWDIYAWGAVAYFLLTGERPRVTKDFMESLRSEASTDARLAKYATSLKASPLKSLRDINPKVDSDLAEVVESCLALDPDARPQNLSDVLEDLERRSSGEPLLCRRPWSFGYRAQRFLRKPLVLATLLFVVLGIFGIGYSYAQLDSKNKALTQKQVELLFERGTMQQETDGVQALFSWSEALALAPRDRLLRFNIQKPRLSLSHQIAIDDEIDSPLGPLHFSQNFVWLVESDIPTRRTLLRYWDLETGEVSKVDLPREIVVQSDALGGVIIGRTEDGLKVLKVPTLQQIGQTLPGEHAWLSGDGEIVVVGYAKGENASLEFYQLSSGELLLRKESPPSYFALSHDGRTFALQTDDGVEIQTLDGEAWRVNEPGARLLHLYGDIVVTELAEKHNFWDYKKGEKVREIGTIVGPGLSTHGFLAETGGGLLWQGRNFKFLPIKIPTTDTSFPIISANGRYLAARDFLSLSVWSGLNGQLVGSIPFSLDVKGVEGMAFNQDETRLASRDSKTLLIFEINPGYKEIRSPKRSRRIAFGPDETILSLQSRGNVESWNPQNMTLKPTDTWQGQEWRWKGGNTNFGPSKESLGGELVAYDKSARKDSRIIVATRDGKEISSLPSGSSRALALNPSDTMLAIAYSDKVTIYEPRNAKELKTIEGKDGITYLQWAGQKLVIGQGMAAQQGTATEIYDSANWSFKRIPGQIPTGASAEQNTLMSTTTNRATLYDLSTLKPRWSDENFSFFTLFDPINDAVFAVDNRTIRYRDAKTGQQLCPPFKWSEDITAIALSDDSKKLAVSGRDGLLRLYELPVIQKGTPTEIQARIEAWTGYTRGQAGRLERLPLTDWESLRASAGRGIGL